MAGARWCLGYKAKGTIDTTIKLYDLITLRGIYNCKESQSYTKDLVIKELQ